MLRHLHYYSLNQYISVVILWGSWGPISLDLHCWKLQTWKMYGKFKYLKPILSHVPVKVNTVTCGGKRLIYIFTVSSSTTDHIDFQQCHLLKYLQNDKVFAGPSNDEVPESWKDTRWSQLKSMAWCCLWHLLGRHQLESEIRNVVKSIIMWSHWLLHI